MGQSTDWTQVFVQLGGAGLALYIMWRVLERVSERIIKSADRQTDAFTEMVRDSSLTRAAFARLEGKMDGILQLFDWRESGPVRIDGSEDDTPVMRPPGAPRSMRPPGAPRSPVGPRSPTEHGPIRPAKPER